MAVVELVVAQCNDVVAHAIHQFDHWYPRLHIVIDKGVARDSISGVHNQNLAKRLILLDKRGELWHKVNVGVHIVGRNDVDMFAIDGVILGARSGKKRYNCR